MRGHAAHDNQHYVAKELLDQWAKRDPIAHLERDLLNKKIASRAEIDEVYQKVDAVLDDDLAWTEKQTAPKAEDALGEVYGAEETRTATVSAGVDRED